MKDIEYPGSDHLPIRLELEREIQGGGARRSRPYGFEAVWIRKHECEDIVRSVWQCDGGSTSSLEMLFKGEHCLIKLFQWSKDLNPSKIIEKV